MEVQISLLTLADTLVGVRGCLLTAGQRWEFWLSTGLPPAPPYLERERYLITGPRVVFTDLLLLGDGDSPDQASSDTNPEWKGGNLITTRWV